jgi:sodium/potassium-transporting ATPase subunit alpha
MKINNLTRDEVLQSLVTSENGLTEEEARKRFLEFGPNEIREVRKKPIIVKFFSQFTHFLAILLWIAALLSFLLEYLNPGERMLTLGVAITAVIFINAVFAFVQEYRAEKALNAMKKLLPFYVKITREGIEKEILAREIVPGDIVNLSEGDKVPADLRLIEANEIKVNNAPLTGESEPAPLITKPSQGEIINSPNVAFAGTTVVSGSGVGVVFATGMRTEFGRIAHLTGTVTPGLSPLQREIVKITKVVTAIAVTTGLIFFVIGFAIGRTFWENFLFAVGIIIANVPEGLLPTVTLSLAMGSQRMSKRKALIKTLTSVETLGSVTVICTDKTGTLTQNRMDVKRIDSLGELTKTDKQRPPLMLTVALLCNNTKVVEGSLKGEPTEVALYKKAFESIGPIASRRMKEFPFDSDRKRMSTVNLLNGETHVMTKGAPESVFSICSHCLTDGEIVQFDEALREKAVSLYHSVTDEGLRVLAFAHKQVKNGEVTVRADDAEKNMVFLGLMGLEDPPRPEVPEAIRKCREAGIRIIMITGDGSRTALAIAREIGLVRKDPTIVEDDEFLRMSDDELRRVLAKEEIILSRMTPKRKLRVVNILKEEGERVAVTGDGVNDAPALKRADIGIAMGLTGTDVAKESADMILLDDNFATIVNAVEEGRAIFENIKKFIIYIFAHLTPEAVPYILFVLFRIPLPLTVMQILAIDLGTETIPALGLGTEPPEADIMKRPPRPKDKGLVDRTVLFNGYIFLGLLSTIGVLFAYFFVLHKGGWRWGVDLPIDHPLVHQASTATFLGIVIMQVANVFACRTQKDSVFKVGIFSNRVILWGIAIEILLSFFIIYQAWGNRIFSTAAIPYTIWMILIPFAILLFATAEVRKLITRKVKKESSL